MIARLLRFICRCHCSLCAFGNHCSACVDWNESQRLPKESA